jgi:hypothetical protein
MSQETHRPATEPRSFRVVSVQESLIREQTLRAAHVAQPDDPRRDRRLLQRIPYARLLSLTPVDDDNLTACGEAVYVVGKHLSPQGIDFFHHEPISQRLAVASLENGPDQWLHLLLRITWCRFLRANWYDSGGHFLKIMECSDECFVSPLASPIDLAAGTSFYCAVGRE